MSEKKFDITGMTCSACSARVEKTVSKLEGVDSVTVNLLTNSMKVQFDEKKISRTDIVKAVEKAGYGAEPVDAPAEKTDGTLHGDLAGKRKTSTYEELRQMKQRLIVSIVFLIPLMYLSMGHMLQMDLGMPVPEWIQTVFYGDENAVTMVFAQFLLLLPILYVNRKFFSAGFKSLFHGGPNMDTLIAVGSAAALAYGCFALFRIGYGMGHGDMHLVHQYSMDIYFESAGTILTLITVGKFLETRSKGKTSEAIEKLMDLSPKTAIVERDGNQKIIPAEQVRKGDVVMIKPGASIPVDGVVLEGRSSVDEAAITGESIPVEKAPGDSVVSATINQSGFFKMKASRVGEDTTIHQIIRLVEEASSSKAPIAKLADKIAGVFVPLVMSIALATVIIWILFGASFEFALSAGIAVLVISCPCALGLATPVAIMVGTGKGAENGILIKSGEALETAHSIDTVVMDKTGTITRGKPQVTDVYSYGAEEEELIRLAASLEKPSEHPLAAAILSYAEKKGIHPKETQDFKALHGQGVTAVLDGKRFFGGNEKLLAEQNIPAEHMVGLLEQLADQGKTPLVFAHEKAVLGVIAVADVEKATSRRAIQLFSDMNIRVVMMTGDNERTAKAMQKKLGIPEVIAGVMPDDKEKHIRRLQEQGCKVAMIGDGINDAPALARSDVGIAIGAGTEVAIESADAVLIRNDLLDAVTAIRLSKAVIRNIKQNLFWAFFYNCIGIPLAAGVFYQALGWQLNPMFAAAAMSLSSICVVSNALRLKLFQPEHRDGAPAAPEEKTRKEKEQVKNYEVELKIEGMMCKHCEANVLKALSGIDGAKVQVNLEAGTADVISDSEISEGTFRSIIEEAGYELKEITRK